MPALLDLVLRVVAASAEVFATATAGATPLALAAVAVALATTVAIAVLAANRSYRGVPRSAAGIDRGAYELVRPLVSQSDPDAAGHVRSRAPGVVPAPAL